MEAGEDGGVGEWVGEQDGMARNVAAKGGLGKVEDGLGAAAVGGGKVEDLVSAVGVPCVGEGSQDGVDADGCVGDEDDFIRGSAVEKGCDGGAVGV